MAETPPGFEDLPTGSWDRLDRAVKAFEDAWQRGECPRIDAWLPPEGPQRRRLLAELAGVDLERRLKAGQAPLTFKGHNGRVTCVCFSPDGKLLASGSLDQTVKIWGARQGQEEFTFAGHQHSISGVSFSPDGKRLASASWDETVKLWDTERGLEVLTLQGHSSGVNSVCFSPDGKHLASSSQDGTVKIWDASSGQGVNRALWP